MSYLVFQLLHKITHQLDLIGETLTQELRLSKESFSELKEWAKGHDTTIVKAPELGITFSSDGEPKNYQHIGGTPLLPDLLKEQPEIKIDDYTFKIIIECYN